MSSCASSILVVEDDPNQQELMQMVLKHIGVTEPIHCAGDAMAAIAYLQGEGPYPTLIITDLQMSPGDGYALLLYLRNHPSVQHCPIVVFSSLNDEEHIARAKQLGASYIVKPMTFADTCRVLRALFPQKEAVRTHD
jgi:two-component system, response regulator